MNNCKCSRRLAGLFSSNSRSWNVFCLEFTNVAELQTYVAELQTYVAELQTEQLQMLSEACSLVWRNFEGKDQLHFGPD